MKSSSRITAPLAATLALLSLISAGCKGPKHLSTANYKAGKAAMDLLDQEATATDERQRDSWQQAASEQMEKIGSKNLELYTALIDYSAAIMQVHITRLKQRSAQLDLGLAGRERSATKAKAANQAMMDAQREEAQALVNLKICRDDADQWFTDGAPATNTCHAIIEKIAARNAKEVR